MTLKQIGVAVAVAGVAVAAWLGTWNMMDRRFAELRAEIRDVRGRLDDMTADVNVLVGRRQERDREPAD